MGLLTHSLFYSSIHISALPFTYLFVLQFCFTFNRYNFFSFLSSSRSCIRQFFRLFLPASIYSSAALGFDVRNCLCCTKPLQDFGHVWQFSGVNAAVFLGRIDTLETVYTYVVDALVHLWYQLSSLCVLYLSRTRPVSVLPRCKQE